MKRALLYRVFLDKDFFVLKRIGRYEYAWDYEFYEYEENNDYYFHYDSFFDDVVFRMYLNTVEFFQKLTKEARKRLRIIAPQLINLPINSGSLLINDLFGERVLRSYVGVDAIVEKVYLFADIIFWFQPIIDKKYDPGPIHFEVEEGDTYIEIEIYQRKIIQEGNINAWFFLELLTNPETVMERIKEMIINNTWYYYGDFEYFIRPSFSFPFWGGPYTFIPLKNDPEGYIWFRYPDLKYNIVYEIYRIWEVYAASYPRIYEKGYSILQKGYHQENVWLNEGVHRFYRFLDDYYICQGGRLFPKKLHRQAEEKVWREIKNYRLMFPRNWLFYVPSEFKNYFLKFYREWQKEVERGIMEIEMWGYC